MQTQFEQVETTASIGKVNHIFKNNAIDWLPVVQNGYLKGMIQRIDWIDYHAANKGSTNTQAATLMNRDFVILQTTDTLKHAQDILDTGLFPVIPVVNSKNKLVGILIQSPANNHQTDNEVNGNGVARWF